MVHLPTFVQPGHVLDVEQLAQQADAAAHAQQAIDGPLGSALEPAVPGQAGQRCKL